ncbi:MAG: response regulator transcription factor [Moraxellaceae bacterium]|nr:response regulator transcription factor [Moraxellaceae bacterium]
MNAGLASLLADQPGIDVQLTSGPAFLADGAARPHAPDLLLTDYCSGMEYLAKPREARRQIHDGMRVVIISSRQTEYEIRMAVERGVHGYLLQDCRPAELADAVLTVSRGARYISPTIAQRLADSLIYESLTLREVDVLRLIAQGLCNKSIAKEFGIAVGTVKSHVRAILEKLQASSRTEAASIAVKRGMLADTQATEEPLHRLPVPGDFELAGIAA